MELSDAMKAERGSKQDKYTYFLLATAAAAIGFSVQQTSGDRIAWPHSLLLIATACWVYSFWCGCKRINVADSSLTVNIQAIDLCSAIRARVHHDPGNKELEILLANTAAEEIQGDLSQKAGWYWRQQFNCLIAGAGFFVAWHVCEMLPPHSTASPPSIMPGVGWVSPSTGRCWTLPLAICIGGREIGRDSQRKGGRRATENGDSYWAHLANMNTHKFQTQTGILAIRKNDASEDEAEFLYAFRYDLKDWKNLEFIQFAVSGLGEFLEPLSRTDDGRAFLRSLGRELIPQPKIIHLDGVPALVADIIFMEGTWSYIPHNSFDPMAFRAPQNLIVEPK